MSFLILLAGGVVSIVVGSIWYGPLFGRAWMLYLGATPEEAKKMAGSAMMKKSYLIAFLSSVVMTFVMKNFENYTGVYTFSRGVIFGTFMWLGFVVPVLLSNVLWEKKPWKIFMIGAGYYLVLLSLIGGMVAVWY